MKNNYPIKYAVIPMVEQVGWTHGVHDLERDYGIVCFIVSKCYLVSESKKYEIDGTVERKYQVVCPFKELDYYKWVKDEPTYNGWNGQCTNAISTDTLFDSFEDAKKYKDQMNDTILTNKFVYMPTKAYQEKHKEIEEEFNKTLEFYNLLETEIEERTKDLKVDSTYKEQKVIRLRDNECGKIKASLYEIMKLFDTNNYIAYSITLDEFKELQELSDDNTVPNKYNHTPLLINNGKLKTARVVSLTGKDLYYINNGLVDKKDIVFEKPNNFENIFYTIEDYEDIVKSCGIKNDKNKIIKLERK